MTTPLRVLLVEDSEDDAQLVLRQLRVGGYDPQWTRVDTPERMATALTEQAWDIVICDYSLPRFDALAALELAQAGHGEVPFIVVSGKIGEETAVAAMKAGAHDYVMKDRLHRLPAAVERELHEARNRHEQRKTEAELRERTRNLQFLQDYSTHLHGMPEHESIEAYAVAAVREYVGAAAVLLSKYVAERRTLETRHVATESRVLKIAATLLRTEVVGFRTQVPADMYRRILESHVAILGDAHEASFGAIPKIVATVLGNALGVGEFVAMPLIHQGQLWGTMMCLMPKGTARPDTHALETAAEMTAQAIARRETQERFRVSFERSSIGKAITSCEGCLLQVNDAFAAMLGYRRDELEGRLFDDFTHPDDRAHSREVANHLLGGTAFHRFEKRYLRKDGGVVWTDANVAAVRDQAGKPQYFISGFVDITERKRDQEALAQSEEKYRKLHESMRDGYAFVTMDGVVRDSNLAFRDMVGYEPEELERLSYVDLTPPCWHAMEAAIVRDEILARGFSSVYEKEYRHKSGKVFPVELRAFLIRDDQAQPQGMWAIVRDITQRRQATRELRLKDAAMAHSTNPIVITDPDGRLRYVNRAWEHLHGYEAAEVVGRMAVELWPEDASWFTEALGAGGGVVCERELRRKDGSTLFVQVSVSLVLDEGNQLVAVLVSEVNVTERKRAEELLARSEARYRDLVANLEDVVFSTDDEGRITYMSPAVERLYGYRPDEMVGRLYSDFVHPEDLPGVAESFARTLASEVAPFEYRVFDKHGQIRHLRSTSRARMEDGRVAGMDGVIVDFTELRQSQAAHSASEVRFRTAFMTSSDGNVIIRRHDGRILEANDRFLEMYGYAREEVLGRTSLELGMWGKPAQRQQVLSALEQSGRVRDMDVLAVRKGGETFPVLYSVTPLHLAGQPPLYLGAIRDVTEAKRNQDKLQQQLRFATLMAVLAARFLDASDEELDAAINEAQQNICDCLGLDRSSVWQPQEGAPERLVLTHAFLGKPGTPARTGVVAQDLFPWTLEQLRLTRKTVALVDIATLPPEAGCDRLSYTSLGVTSTVTIPWCTVEGTINGIINFSSMGGTAASPVVAGQLETLAQIILVVLGST